MKLKNPPIVEAWIEFHMRGNETAANWKQGIKQFFDEIKEEYPEPESIFVETFHVEKRSSAGVPEQLTGKRELHRVRAFNTSRSQCVQVGRDTLIFNLIKGDGPYEGFDALLPMALRQFQRYIEIFRPKSVLYAVLHNKDLVRIPKNPDSATRLEQYFRLGIQVPEETQWVLGAIKMEISINLNSAPQSKDQLILGFQRDIWESQIQEDRYRMDWHAICPEIDSLDTDLLRNRLEAAHDAMRQRFRDCFTDRTWELFAEEVEN